ncbi:hypothetical protein ATO12_17830 [Aquimarina atlantica]|uniref:Uncharacterized protein n=1 Tax=Aquimarina atlantica TaxID=1317122 RepID=A0A023BVG7_9FLAO|nr:hypothetical protein [Aquimarina atlantica]EZH73793.1 hypothetical protein ATO12_17830 [Aquimarina atlantica]
MKFTINILFLFIFTFSFSQNQITYEKTLSDIKKSSKVLCTNLIIPNNDFSIGIYTKEWEVEDLTIEQCGDIKTDSIKSSKIIEILSSGKLLDKLYLNMENNKYESINSSDKFEWNKANLIVELNFTHNWNSANKVYIPINNKTQTRQRGFAIRVIQHSMPT